MYFVFCSFVCFPFFFRLECAILIRRYVRACGPQNCQSKLTTSLPGIASLIASLVATLVATPVAAGVATIVSSGDATLVSASECGGAEDVGVTALADLPRTPALAVLANKALTFAVLVAQVAVR